MHAHHELQHAARVGLGHLEMQAAERGFLADFGQVADFRGHHAADGVELLVAEVASRSAR